MSYEDTQSTHDQLKLQNKRTTYCESKMETSQKNNTNTRKDTHTHTHTRIHTQRHIQTRTKFLWCKYESNLIHTEVQKGTNEYSNISVLQQKSQQNLDFECYKDSCHCDLSNVNFQ